MANRYYIPNNLDNWKWPRHINPHYAEVKAESAAWARSFGAFSPKAQDAYDRCDFSKIYRLIQTNSITHFLLDRLACLAYPLHNKGEHLSKP
jgi:hypothetical protein